MNMLENIGVFYKVYYDVLYVYNDFNVIFVKNLK